MPAFAAVPDAHDRPRDVHNLTLADFESGDASMRSCLDLARAAAGTDLPILILGESGTGKTLLARAIHNSSKRARKSFVSFNAAALSDTLLDSQLFGHEKGAFTGADRRVKGKFELSHAGTLFIDEIADMSPAAQSKILRAVEYGEFERLGSENLERADVRLISATHLPLERFMTLDQFRRDLFYRLSGITIALPPLRERPADLRSLLATEIVSAARTHGKTIRGLDERALDLVLSHTWPGNLRELSRVIQAAVSLCGGEVIQPDTILRVAPSVDSAPAPAEADRLPAGDLTLRTAELRHIGRVIALVSGNKRKAAHALGVARSTLDRKLRGARAPHRR